MSIKTYFIIVVILLFSGCVQTQIPTKEKVSKQKVVVEKKEIKKIKIKKDFVEFKQFSKAHMKKVSFTEIEDFENDDLQKAFEVFKKDCQASKRKLLLRDVCKEAFSTDDAKDFFINNFYMYKLINKDGSDKGLITGYYEPILNGSLKKTKKFKYAIYKTPSNLITVDVREFPQLKGMRIRGKVVGNRLVKYPERKDIEKERELKPICYVDNKVDLFFMHIQGSGKVKLQNGKMLNINYASQNGRGYYAIGKALIKKKILKKSEVSLQSIKKWLQDNPNKADEILNLNKSYIFFEEGDKGATGALGIELVANRNIAVDRRYIPLGLPVFIQTKNPITKDDINQLMIAADVGGAIKGKIRADFYFGSGQEAGALAGKMKEKGTLIVLLPKGVVDAYNK